MRELQNAIERAVITAKNGRVEFHLPGARSAPVASPGAAEAGGADPGPSRVLTDEAIREIERANLLAALEQTGWKIYGVGGAAELLGMKPTTVASRMQRLGLTRPDAR